MFCGSWFFGGIGGQVHVDVECLVHILNPKCCDFVGLHFLEVQDVKCVLMYNFLFII
jgi:hypothetical protein